MKLISELDQKNKKSYDEYFLVTKTNSAESNSIIR